MRRVPCTRERSCERRVVPPSEGNEVRRNERQGTGDSPSTYKAGELASEDRVEEARPESSLTQHGENHGPTTQRIPSLST